MNDTSNPVVVVNTSSIVDEPVDPTVVTGTSTKVLVSLLLL